MTVPRIVLAGTNSGSGKTTMTMGLVAALRARGFAVQTYKAGPDYIDPQFHSLVSGRPCRNLDTMLLSRDCLLEFFERAMAGAHIAVIEGVMGLFDGAGPLDERGSTAHLAKLLAAPVVLVANGRAMARSAAALVQGFSRFDAGVDVRGVLFNELGGDGHYRIVREAVEHETGLPVLGYLPKTEAIALPERRLGLIPPSEREGTEELAKRIGELAERFMDVGGLLECARCAGDLPQYRKTVFSVPRPGTKARIAVAMDDAFHFYYRDNLDVLDHLGAELVFFSPLRDERLPPGTAGIYLGGGFPEEFAPRLAGNSSLRGDLASAAERGMPVYAECGGLMYLVERLVDTQGTVHPMTGILPGTARMEGRRTALGYCSARLRRSALVGDEGTVLRGHVFRWSSYDSEGHDALLSLEVERKGATTLDGPARMNVFASHLHLHFGTDLSPARRFIERAEAYGSPD